MLGGKGTVLSTLVRNVLPWGWGYIVKLAAMREGNGLTGERRCLLARPVPSQDRWGPWRCQVSMSLLFLHHSPWLLVTYEVFLFCNGRNSVCLLIPMKFPVCLLIVLGNIWKLMILNSLKQYKKEWFHFWSIKAGSSWLPQLQNRLSIQ